MGMEILAKETFLFGDVLFLPDACVNTTQKNMLMLFNRRCPLSFEQTVPLLRRFVLVSCAEMRGKSI